MMPNRPISKSSGPPTAQNTMSSPSILGSSTCTPRDMASRMISWVCTSLPTGWYRAILRARENASMPFRLECIFLLAILA